MPDDILSMYGPESPQYPDPPFRNGGIMAFRDVMGYQEPTGPINRFNPSPGLPGGTNVGTGPNMGSTGDGGGGRAGIGGDYPCNCGSQGVR